MSKKPGFRRNRIICTSKDSRSKRKAGVDFVQKNIKECLKEQVCKVVDEKCQALVTMNIPKIQLGCSFTRKELYGFYSKFKALSKLSKLHNPENLNIGVSRDIFMSCMK